MSAHVAHPTPYPDVNALLHVLLSNVQALLGHDFLGLYLYGSLASGDFDPQRSDIDFVVVTVGELSDAMIAALETMHARIAASGATWAQKLEGLYMPLHTFRRYDPTYARYPSVNEGRFWVGGYGSDWVIQRHIIREQGVVVAGPPPHTLIEPVHADELRRAVLATLHEWWAPMLDAPARLHAGVYQAFAILTMCRALYTLRYSTIVSKVVAAQWARDALDNRWAALITWAIAWHSDTEEDHMRETVEFIRYTLEHSQQYARSADEV
jgi:hypothetical protein